MTDVMTELMFTFKRVYISVWNDLQYAEIRQKHAATDPGI
jgi:hypothetical protein